MGYRARRGYAAPSITQIWRYVLVIPLLCLCACVINPPIELSELAEKSSPQVLLDTPFFAQDDFLCGPSALATILVHSGVDISAQALAPKMYLPAREGSLQIELLSATRTQGRIPYVLPPTPTALITELHARRPIVLLQNLGTRSVPLWHYAVLTGFDKERNSFRLNSGSERGIWIKAPRLFRTWSWGGSWALVVLEPGEMPGTVAAGLADEHAIEAFFEAIRNFESVAGSEPASRAWRAASERWPEEAMPFVALGNTAYAQQRLHDAVDWYSRGRSGSPENLVLLNNLASVLGELGCAHKAIELLVPAEKSMSEATVWGSAVRETLDELESQQGDDELSCGRW